MTSKDDDTLPIPGPSQDLTSDLTADEDFIPTSQPQSLTNSKLSKNSDTSFNRSYEDSTPSQSISISRIDDTFPCEVITDQSTFDNNKSEDFILDTETKAKVTYPKEDVSCKKKLAVFDPENEAQLNPTWEVDVSRIPESPAVDTQNFSILKESPVEVPPETLKQSLESITEIIVNDSAETVDLEASPLKIKKTESEEKMYRSVDVERCEETQNFHNSSILFLDQPGTSGLNSQSTLKINGIMNEPYFQETIDDNKENSQDRANSSDSQCSPALVTGKLESLKHEANQNEVQARPSHVDQSKLVYRKLDVKLAVSCLISFNVSTNKVLHKSILNVSEIPKPRPKPPKIESSDNGSEKSKRHSSSSSGSVYSDKSGLFGLPKRHSIVSDMTDSSEDDLRVAREKAKRNLERVPWCNEYLFPLAIDDIIQAAIDDETLLRRPNMSPPRIPKSRNRGAVEHLKEILESSSSCGTSVCESAVEEPQLVKIDEKVESLENSEVEKTVESINESAGGEKAEKEENCNQQKPIVEEKTEEEHTSISLSDGLPVFARWTDKRYYSGVLSGDVKNNRWNVKFDDGTEKPVREDLIMPADWLKVGSLAFALVDDKYISGQITNIKRGEEVTCVVELDIEKKEVSVKMSDLCLTDVMAGIVREKYKPFSGTPRGRADIDFDNVLSGKRLREQNTPLKPTTTVGAGSSGLRKKSSKTKNGQSLQSIQETPKSKEPISALQSDNGHLVEDKTISADSPSENETPLRKKAKDPKGKAVPRSLSYEAEEISCGNSKSWLAPDGTPIPGPSGIKMKKQKTKEVGTKSSKKSQARSSGVTRSSERSKRKRKLDEPEETIQKKSMKEGSKAKARSRKG